MAFLCRPGNLLRHAANRKISSEIRSLPSSFQSIRSLMRASLVPTSKLFVGGLSYSAKDDDLVDVFSKYGNLVIALAVNNLRRGKPRGFGIVSYTSVEDATRALRALNGQFFHGRRLRINYTKDRYANSYFDDRPCPDNFGTVTIMYGGSYRGSGMNYGNDGSGGGSFGDARGVCSHETFGGSDPSVFHGNALGGSSGTGTGSNAGGGYVRYFVPHPRDIVPHPRILDQVIYI